MYQTNIIWYGQLLTREDKLKIFGKKPKEVKIVINAFINEINENYGDPFRPSLPYTEINFQPVKIKIEDIEI